MVEYRIAAEELKKLGEMELAQDASIEELRAIARILTKAGLIVRIEDRTLTILVKER